MLLPIQIQKTQNKIELKKKNSNRNGLVLKLISIFVFLSFIYFLHLFYFTSHFYYITGLKILFLRFKLQE